MKRDEFDKDMVQLLNLLKKILKSHPQSAQFSNLLSPKQIDKINLNLCFFNFLGMSPEDLEEFEEAYSEFLEQDSTANAHAEPVDFGWNQNDIDFLKRHGMSF